MAYQHVNATAQGEFLHRTLHGIKSVFTSIAMGLVHMSTANQRLERVQRLTAKSDEELAVLGLRREDIVRHVFSDVF